MHSNNSMLKWVGNVLAMKRASAQTGAEVSLLRFLNCLATNIG